MSGRREPFTVLDVEQSDPEPLDCHRSEVPEESGYRDSQVL